MSRTAPDRWMPVGVEDLEPVANRVVRATMNTLVEAGPGAGKTEMLAQRACFLLQTGACRSPRRILALSYKRDAARNLRERVARRAGDDAHRLLSVTLDAFAKDLLDRFGSALPPPLQLRSGYIIQSIDQLSLFLTTVKLPKLPGDVNELRGMDPQEFLNRHYCHYELWPPRPPATIFEYAADELFQLRHRQTPSRLDFQMIGRLAEAILIANPRLLSALRAAFSHVFIDEFQDTTTVQYALLRTACLSPSVVVTAVGDDKQRIMGWAGAMDDSFKEFSHDFKAKPEFPIINYRSAPELIMVLTHLASALTGSVRPMTPCKTSQPGGQCRLLAFDSDDHEASTIAAAVKRWIDKDGLVPGDVAVLVRQKTPEYGARIAAALAKVGVRVRIESPKTEFLGSQFAVDLAAVLRLAIHRRAPDEWDRIRSLLHDLEPGAATGSIAAAERAFHAFCRRLAKALTSCSGAADAVRKILETLIDHFGRDAYLRARGRTGDKESLSEVLDALSIHMERVYAETHDWVTTIDDAAGLAFVPVMTIHKAKGREYHTVFFIGLEDGAFWKYNKDPDEALRSFFVAFSRARRRVFFTFAETRQGRSQSRTTIKPIYDLLKSAGVQRKRIVSKP